MLQGSWYKDPFSIEIDPKAKEAKYWEDFKASNAIKLTLNNKTDDSSFWLSLHDSYPLLSKKTSVILVQFATTYLCEAGFSDLTSIKTNSRNHLNAYINIRLAQSKTEPNIKVLLRRV